MRAPHFLRLAQIDKQHFITACRSGVVHLTWGRTTTRLTSDEFRRMACLLEQAAGAETPLTLRDGALRLSYRCGEECELRIETMVLLLSPDEFQELAHAAPEAADRLDEILASGAWDEPEEESAPPNPFAQLGSTSFSPN